MAALGELRRMALAACKLYISESRNPSALQSIERAAKGHRLAPLLHVFDDKDYNRVGYTLAGALPLQSPPNSQASLFESLPLSSTVKEMVRAAVATIDLRDHIGTHPRIGVVDHICFSALGSASLEEVASFARFVAADIASQLKVPTFLYGAAHSEGRPLDAVRRALGYFQSNGRGQWKGSPALGASLSPDFGPEKASPKTGVIVVGATPWVMNYNVPLATANLEVGRKIARKLSQRGGGLPEVQSMALLHEADCIEVACNLLNVEKTSPDKVQEAVASLAKSEGVDVRPGYLTGYQEDEVLELALRRLLSTINSREGLVSHPHRRKGA